METQSRNSASLVDPFGRALEALLSDAPAARASYVPELVVPPITAPIRRPTPDDLARAAGVPVRVDAPFALPLVAEAPVSDAPAAVALAPDALAPDALAPLAETTATAFRRDRGRHARHCAPAFPEPPERFSLAVDDLVVAVSATSGRTTLERLDLFAGELARQDEDRARVAAWEARVAPLDDPEVAAARGFVRDLFADLLAEARAEAADLERRRARRAARAADARTATPVLPAPSAVRSTTSAPAVSRWAPALPALVQPAAPVSPPVADVLRTAMLGADLHAPRARAADVDPAEPEDAFTAALRAHGTHTDEIPVLFPLAPASSPAETSSRVTTVTTARPAWWRRIVGALLAPFRR